MSRFNRFASGPTKVTVTSSTGQEYVDYRNIDALRRMMSPNGKINTRKRTGLNAPRQRLAAQAIKRARYMALLPYTSATL
ncbi:MAG: 30S ribosomal protein S18 [Phycisphaerae bacterium]|nr:30S ribosomal protein S18 [Phycisphaerae bacterium]